MILSTSHMDIQDLLRPALTYDLNCIELTDTFYL